MQTMLIWAGFLFVVVFIVHCVKRARKQPTDERASAEVEALAGSLAPENLMLTTADDSRERVLSLGLSLKGSEDVSGMLVRPANRESGNAEGYPPKEGIEWVIDIPLPEGTLLQRDEICEVFIRDWQKTNKDHKINLYAQSPEDNRWHSYFYAEDAKLTYDRLAIGVPLAGIDVDSPRTIDDLKRTFTKITAASKSVKGVNCKARTIAESAVEDSKKVFATIQKFEEEEAVIVLDANGKTFEGKDIWDTMMSLGLEWGDGDLFHWEKEQDNAGDEHLFSVATNSGPTSWYFIPEHIAAGEFEAGDLVFSFSIPRSADPVQVFDNMLEAARYAQKRLGGKLEGENGEKLDEEAARDRLKKIADEMTSSGLPPGADHTMRVI